jgi:hypothetical protein
MGGLTPSKTEKKKLHIRAEAGNIKIPEEKKTSQQQRGRK